jgi:hypothetical protein
MADKTPYPHPYMTFAEKVAHVRNTQAISMQNAADIVRREEFEERIWRCDTLHDLQSALVEILPFIKFREQG